eukprot:GHVR01045851.1.p1 GENE.GHVR01045851.1~~GHVR01045851.1.p1  ORF type:complete len:163 (-),score=13.24 GHVR01045851.1:423-911(-)
MPNIVPHLEEEAKKGKCSVSFVDLETSGKSGNATFPFNLNVEAFQGYKGRLPVEGSLVTVEHDIMCLSLFLSQLGLNEVAKIFERMAGEVSLKVSSPSWKNVWDDAELTLDDIVQLHIRWEGKPNYQTWVLERMDQWKLNKLEFEKHKAEKQSRSKKSSYGT